MSITRVGQISITVKVDLFDVNAFAQIAEDITTLVAKQAALSPQVTIEHSIARVGRPSLTEQEWEEQFAKVNKILALSEKSGIRVEQACTRVGTCYSSFRYWRRKMKLAQDRAMSGRNDTSFE